MAYVNELAGSKLRSKLGATLNEAVSAPTSAFAQKQLEKMGWTSGQGLGKNKQGMSSHIKVKKREDDVGLGHVKHELQTQQQWWNDSMGDVLSKLSGGSKKAKKKMTDEDLYKATGGKRFGMRAQRKQKGKWARSETISEEAEKEAKSKVEWDGQGKAQIILKKDKKKKRKSEDDDEQPKKKKRKKNKEVVAEGGDDASPKKKKKEKKSDKKKEKKAKKSKKLIPGNGQLC